jgi:hypothetical protein
MGIISDTQTNAVNAAKVAELDKASNMAAMQKARQLGQQEGLSSVAYGGAGNFASGFDGSPDFAHVQSREGIPRTFNSDRINADFARAQYEAENSVPMTDGRGLSNVGGTAFSGSDAAVDAQVAEAQYNARNGL